jgi:hypothetical protein
MLEQSTNSEVSTKTTPQRLEERLNHHPELKARIETLLSVVENAEGNLVKANEAEQRVVEEIQKLGQAALQGWASRQNQVQSDDLVQANPQAQRTRKKTSTGTVAADASRL